MSGKLKIYNINTPLIIKLAEAAWSVLNHDNDYESAHEADIANWKRVREKIADVLNKHQHELNRNQDGVGARLADFQRS